MMHTGSAAEQAACQFLQQQGLTLVTRNFRCRQGELDLVMLDRQVLVFVEVRLRNNPRFGGALASVTARKQQRLIRAAQYFLSQYPEPRACRFDVVGFDGESQPVWIADAFGC